MDAERDVYDTKNKSKRAIFKYEQEGKFCIGVAKAEIKEDWTTTGKRFTVFDYTGKNCHHRCLQKINRKIILNNKESYFIVVTMG